MSAGHVATDQAPGPLAGVQVIDLTTTFMGPYCTMLMAQMGADVVKVEPPDGDIVRNVGTGRNAGMGPIFLNANRGKRSLALQLKSSEGRNALLRLVRKADVFVTNMRPEAISRLGIDHGAMLGANPSLVYCALLGFGSSGPYGGYAAYDDVIQAISGIASVQGGDGPPEYVRTPLADKAVGLMGLSAITAALFARERTGRGQVVEVPMFEAMASFALLEQQGGYVFDPPLGPVGYARTASLFRRPYRTADGYLGVLIYTDRQWQRFFESIGRSELAQDDRFRTIKERNENIDELYRLVETSLQARSSADWVKEFEALGIPCVPVLTIDDLLDDSHLDAVDFFQRTDHPTEGRLVLSRLPMTFSDGAGGRELPAPRLGEHGREVLLEAGLTNDQVAHLVAAGIVKEIANSD